VALTSRFLKTPSPGTVIKVKKLSDNGYYLGHKFTFYFANSSFISTITDHINKMLSSHAPKTSV